MTGVLWYIWTGFVVATVMREPHESWLGALRAGLVWPAVLWFILVVERRKPYGSDA